MIAAWGRTEPGEQIRLRYQGRVGVTMAGETGWWLAVMPTQGDDDAWLEPANQTE
jgi:hypothetical protein